MTQPETLLNGKASMTIEPSIDVDHCPEELPASKLYGLLGVFLLGLFLLVAVKGFFSNLQSELDQASQNERVRLRIGDALVHGIQELEKDFYHLASLGHLAQQRRKAEEIDVKVHELHGLLGLLEKGGTFQQEIELNVEGHEKIQRSYEYRPSVSRSGIWMESIEIAPLLDQSAGKSEDLIRLLRARVEAREHSDPLQMLRVEDEVAVYLKRLPPYFERLTENANRMFYEANLKLTELETRLELDRRAYQQLEQLVVVFVIGFVTIAGVLFARNIRASNRRLRQAWEAMRAAKVEAERASRSKSDFVSRMSHELRTPMNAILGFSQLLDRDTLSREHREWVMEIRRAGHHLLELINQVLDLSKIEAGGLTLESLSHDLLRTADDVVNLVGNTARAKGLKLRYFASPKLPSALMGDPTRLRQVLINLLGNAVKFTQEGYVELRIEPSDDGRRVVFCVKDSGIGMDAKALSRLFTPFSQADESTTRHFGGTGLGLAISRDLVRAMGGDIEVRSASGLGSEFRFELPLTASVHATPREPLLAGYRCLVDCADVYEQQALAAYLGALGADVSLSLTRKTDLKILKGDKDTPWLLVGGSVRISDWLGTGGHVLSSRDLVVYAPAVGEALGTLPNPAQGSLPSPLTFGRVQDLLTKLLRPEESRVQAAHEESLSALNGMHVLLVEDNKVNQMVASRMLRRLGVSFDLADHGEQALEMWHTNEYHAVLMDMQMPVMDGVTATMEIRRREAALGREALPVIAMTANALKEDKDRCFAAGMNDHIAKPVEMDQLKAVLLQWHRRTQAEPVTAAELEPA